MRSQVPRSGCSFLRWSTVSTICGPRSPTCWARPELASGPFGFLPYPFFVCLLGGLLIGLYEKLTGTKTDDLNQVMAKVKQDGRYPYDNLGRLSLAALLPLLFGGSIGPEAGLTGVIAGLCSWVGDRMRRCGAALFTAPVFGFVAPLAGSADGQGEDADDGSASGEITIKLPKAQKTVVYGIAIAGGLGTYLLLGQLVGGGMGMPRFEAAEVGNLELAWLIPLALVGTVCGWLYFVSEHASEALSHAIGERPVVKAMLAGETQADVLMETYLTIPAGVLIATGLVKAMLTPALINLGWRGGHFFPVIFSGVSLGYGLAILTGADPVFCVAVCTASTMGAVMRQPVMVVGLLLMCFPLKGIVCMIIAAVIAAGIPLPKPLRK